MKSLTLFQLVFALALVFKIGQIGTFATMGWGWVFLPLALDLVFKFFSWVYKIGKFESRLTDEVKFMRVRRMQRKTDKAYNNAINDFKKELKNGNAAN